MSNEGLHYLTVTEIIHYLQLSRNEVYSLIRSGKLKASRIGHHGRKSKYNRHPWRVKRTDLEEFIEQGKNSPPKTGARKNGE